MASVKSNRAMEDAMTLPDPRPEGVCAVERALHERRSIRNFSDAALAPAELSQLLWAAQGITDRQGLRTAPSAGALYPVELYAIIGKVDGLSAGVYKYRPAGHRLAVIVKGDRRGALASAARAQDWVQQAAVILAFSAVERRTTCKYGQRGVRYIHIEVGHAAQNVFLQAGALGLAAAVVGAFDDDAVHAILGAPPDEAPLYLMPVGQSLVVS